MTARPLITIAIPVYNEEGNIDGLYSRLCALRKSLEGEYRFEFLFTDNHSTDNTWNLLADLARNDADVRAIKFSRNFGFQRSILANYMHARGDIVMQIDADLQDPPELLHEFLEKWREGFKVVYGVRRRRAEGWLVMRLRQLGYWAVNKLSAHEIPMNAGDFRLIDRQVLDALLQVKSPAPYLRGAISGLGFKQIGVEYDRVERTAGESKFNIRRVVSLGVDAILNHSTYPLRFASIMGAAIMLGAVVGVFYYIGLKLVDQDAPQGLVSIHVLVLIGIGMNAIFLGIIGEYILRIYSILSNDPLVIVEDVLGLEKNEIKV